MGRGRGSYVGVSLNVLFQSPLAAGKEYSIEQALDKMQREWEKAEMIVLDYRETGTYVIKVWGQGNAAKRALRQGEVLTFFRTCSPVCLQVEEQVMQMLDDHIVMTQSMGFSPYKKPFEERIIKWEQQLNLVRDDGLG